MNEHEISTRWQGFLLLIVVLSTVAFFQDSRVALTASPARPTVDHAPDRTDSLQTILGGFDDTNLVDGNFHRLHNGPIDSIRILGERHSGTNYLTSYLGDCFPNLEVKRFFIRDKHWFQPSPRHLQQVVSSTDPKLLLSLTNIGGGDSCFKPWSDIAADPNNVFRSTIVVVSTRDPRQWLEALRLGPWHWPNHVRLFLKDGPIRELESPVRAEFLDWKTFMKQPLYMQNETMPLPVICQKGYDVGTISPCVRNSSYIPPNLQSGDKQLPKVLPFETNDIVYDRNPKTGEPFPHPLALRAAKLQNWLDMARDWNLGGFVAIQYEAMMGGSAVRDESLMGSLLEALANATGQVPQCGPPKVRDKPPYNLPKEMLDWIDKNANWYLESLFGYHPTK